MVFYFTSKEKINSAKLKINHNYFISDFNLDKKYTQMRLFFYFDTIFVKPTYYFRDL